MNGHNGQSEAEVYQDFIFAKTAEGVSDITIRNYLQHLYFRDSTDGKWFAAQPQAICSGLPMGSVRIDVYVLE